MQRRTRRRSKKPLLVQRHPVGEHEKVRGEDGRPIRLGVVVRARPRMSESLGVIVPTRVGRVVLIYRHSVRLDAPIFVAFRNVYGGIHTVRAEHLRRSQAQV